MIAACLNIAPELLLFLVILLLFAQSAAEGHCRPLSVRCWLPAAALAVTVAAGLCLPARAILMYKSYTLDGLSQLFKLFISAGFFILVCNACRQPTLPADKRSDYFLFLSLSALGLMLLCSATELVSLYLALELASYSLYTLIPMRDERRESAEAGAKYILFGAAATAVSLFGLSLIMAELHSTYFSALKEAARGFSANPAAAAGLSLFMCGLFYKLALFPFHFWCPDVYQGASNETASYVATLPKLGAVAVLARLAALSQPGWAATDILACLGLISMTYGNLAALVQKDVKRLLGFSSVAHAGYLMAGLVTGTAKGLGAAVFYALAYLAMNLLCFWVVSRAARDGRNLMLDDLRGLHKKAPVLALGLAVAAFALVGLPPTVGFMGKFLLIASAWDHGYNWLVIGLAVNSAIALYYYLNLVRHAYAEETHGPDAAPSAPDASLFSNAGTLILAALVIALGVFPACVYEYAVRIAEKLP